jgi:octaprenyl-diphosphate synthase
MSQVTHGREKTAQALRSLYAPIHPELDQVEQLLRDELSSENPFVDRLVKHGFRLGGKRLRPALVLLSGKACGIAGREHVLLGAAVELIHTATLIHDDVLDEADLRRHRDTVNARWDNEASILLGDYLLARSIRLVSSLDTVFACRAVAEASKLMCEGELRQVAGRGDYDVDEEKYLGIISGKTAELCACCCRLGAHYAGADAQKQEALARFGHHLGIAFQIADDLLDVLGDEAVVGKSLGTDLVKQKTTLPLIRLLDQLVPADRDKVVGLLSNSHHPRYDALEPWFDRTDAIAYTRGKAMHYTRLAQAELRGIDASPAEDAMRRLADFVVDREH